MPHCPADLPGTLTAELGRIALAAWRVVGGAGYGRVDMRIDEAVQPWILEVNANPDFAPTAGLARMARMAGIDYAAMVRLVCGRRSQRARRRPRIVGLASNDCRESRRSGERASRVSRVYPRPARAVASVAHRGDSRQHGEFPRGRSRRRAGALRRVVR